MDNLPDGPDITSMVDTVQWGTHTNGDVWGMLHMRPHQHLLKSLQGSGASAQPPNSCQTCRSWLETVARTDGMLGFQSKDRGVRDVDTDTVGQRPLESTRCSSYVRTQYYVVMGHREMLECVFLRHQDSISIRRAV